jgi:hypothetical protein
MGKHRLNSRMLLTSVGAAMFASSIPAFFGWGLVAALMCAAGGLVMVVFGQTRPRQRGGRRWH